MKRKRHRLLSLLLIVTMVLGLIPAATITVSAAEININETASSGSDLEITENTTISIAKGATYTVPNLVFKNSNPTLTITDGGTLKVNTNITSTGSDITIIIVDGSILDSVEVMPGTPEVTLSDEDAQDKPGIRGYDVNITAGEGSFVKAYNITGGSGSPRKQHYNMLEERMVCANPGDGGEVILEVSGASFIANTITYGERGDAESGTNGKVAIQLTNGYLESTEYIKGGVGGTLIISSGAMYAPDLRDIQPTLDGTIPLYRVYVSVPTGIGGNYTPMTYKLDGGAEIATKAKNGTDLFLWLAAGEHQLLISDGTKKYSASGTVSNSGSNNLTAVPIPLMVKNGEASSYHTTWAAAAAAVQEGGTITLLEEVTMRPGDTLPAVPCTIDGGTDLNMLTPGSNTVHMQANLTLKNMGLGMSGFDNTTLITGNGASGYPLTLEGKVRLGDNGISGSGLPGSAVVVKGQLECASLVGVDSLQIDTGGTAAILSNIGAKNIVNNGSITFRLYTQVNGGSLSGTGDLVCSGEFTGSRLQFLNGAAVASDAALTLKTDFYTPAQGDLMAVSIPTVGANPDKVANIERLLFHTAFGDLMLTGAADTANNQYHYTLAPALAEVTNGQTATRYASWNEASKAVLTGGVITLLKDVNSSTIGTMPSVPYTLDGHGHTLSGYDIYLNADATLMDITFEYGPFIATNSSGDPCRVTIEGTVTAPNVFLNGKPTGSQITVKGTLDCGRIQDFSKITVDTAGVVRAAIFKARNYAVNGTLTHSEEFGIDSGVLSGTGTLVLTSALRCLTFSNGASVASDSTLTLKAEGYTPGKGQPVIQKEPDGVSLPNVGRLMMGETFNAFALDTDVQCGTYRLIDARSFILADKTAAYAGGGIALEAAAITPALGTGETVVYTYYPTEADRTAGTDGSTVAPVNVGTYYGRAVIAKSAECTAAQRDATLTITKTSGLPAPTDGVVEDTANTLAFTPVNGHGNLEQYEYSFDGTGWTALTPPDAAVDGAAIVLNVGNVSGTVKVRLKETSNYEAGALLTAESPFVGTLEGAAAIAGNAAYGQPLTVQVNGVQPGAVMAYQWKRTLSSTTTDVGTGSTYTLGTDDIGAILTVTVTATGYDGALVSQATTTVSKAAGPAAPLAPVISSASTNSITLASIAGAEYQQDAEQWQDSPVFSGLSPASGYAFHIRIKETATHLASAISHGATLHTRSAAPTDTVVTLNYGAETAAFDGTLYEMNTASNFTGAAIASGGNIADYPGQTLYIRTKAVPNGASESAGTAVTIPVRTAAPAIASVAGTLGTGFKVTATVNMGDNGSFVYRADQGPWQVLPEFTGIALDTAHTFEAAYAATATTFASAPDSESKTWTGADFTAEQVAALVTSITPPAKDAVSITLPTVPSGFTVTIKSVLPDAAVLAANGTIAPPVAAVTVKVVLTVTKAENNTTADTTEIAAVIPAKTAAPVSSGGGGGGYNQPTAPSSSINSGKDLSQTDLKQLASKGGTLTVKGSADASLVFDAEALKGIASQAGGSIQATMQDVSAQYQVSHPGRMVHSLTVTSEGKTISQFGGSVAVTLPYTLKQGEDPDRVGIWFLASYGTLTEVPCSYDGATGRVTFKVNHFSLYMIGLKQATVQPGTGSVSMGFADVKADDWFSGAVQYVTEKGLMAGTDAHSFSPQANTTRAMIVTILWRMEGKPAPSGTAAFADVPTGEYYTQAVAWAAKEGIVSGQSADRFAPQQSITREQLAAMLFRYAQYKKQDTTQGGMAIREYADSGSISEYAAPALGWAVNTGLLMGSGNQLLPGGSATRAQVAAVLKRFWEAAH